MTPVMMLVEPVQKNVATMASPVCGLVGLKPFSRTAVFAAASDPLFWSSVIGAPVGAVVAKTGTPTLDPRGLSGSLQPAASMAAPPTTAAKPNTVLVAIASPCRWYATWLIGYGSGKDWTIEGARASVRNAWRPQRLRGAGAAGRWRARTTE